MIRRHSLAEGRWLWRRLYVFGCTVALWVLLAEAIARTDQTQALVVARGLMGLQALTLVLYLVAPSAQQLIAMLGSLRPRLPGGGRP